MERNGKVAGRHFLFQEKLWRKDEVRQTVDSSFSDRKLGTSIIPKDHVFYYIGYKVMEFSTVYGKKWCPSHWEVI